jgi:hypothetical protein
MPASPHGDGSKFINSCLIACNFAEFGVVAGGSRSALAKTLFPCARTEM